MKIQMRFQKIFMLVALIIAALSAVYALLFCSGTLFQIHQNAILYNAKSGEETIVGVKDLYEASQGVSDTLLIMGIVMILVVVLNYIMGTGKRRKYYVTNYVSIGIAIAYSLTLAIVIIALVANCQSLVDKIDWVAAKDEFESMIPGEWKYTTWTLPTGYAMAVLLMLVCGGFVANLVWKIKLMQGEKKLLESGLVREVA